MISIVTPYLNGREMMRLHLQSFRSYFPDAPILVSKAGGGREEMEAHRQEFGVVYWMEECNYDDAALRLLDRCQTEFVCVADHDAILLSPPTPLLEGLVSRDWDLVGIEERIRNHDSLANVKFSPDYKGWSRLSPGYMDTTFLMFNLRSFVRAWGLKGIRPKPPHPVDWELHYGLCEKLPRHKYLRPYHTRCYGIGHAIKDDETVVLWHQRYGAYRERSTEFVGFAGAEEFAAVVDAGERAFLRDFPALDLKDLEAAWGPERDVQADRRAIEEELPALPTRRKIFFGRFRRLLGSPLEFFGQVLRWLDRHRRLR